jgi:hypothetical protein
VEATKRRRETKTDGCSDLIKQVNSAFYMKVLLVHKFWRKVGGAEVYFQDCARILRNHGHQVKIYTTDFNAEGSRDVFHRDENVIFGETAEYLKGNVINRIKNIPEVIYSKRIKKNSGRCFANTNPTLFTSSPFMSQ